MTPEAFTYWLQGFFELRGTDQGLDVKQVKIIRDHLNTVFINVTSGVPAVSPDIYHTPKPFPAYGTVVGITPHGTVSELLNQPPIKDEDFKRLC